MKKWIDVCDVRELISGSGVAVRVAETAVAVFLDPEGNLHGLAHVDPASGAEVIAWGILGEHDGDWYVASPLYKQKYRLRDGRCIDGDAPDLACHDVRVVDGRVQVCQLSGGELPPPEAVHGHDMGAAATL